MMFRGNEHFFFSNASDEYNLETTINNFEFIVRLYGNASASLKISKIDKKSKIEINDKKNLSFD